MTGGSRRGFARLGLVPAAAVLAGLASLVMPVHPRCGGGSVPADPGLVRDAEVPGQLVEVEFVTFGCHHEWTLRRRGRYADGVLTLDGPLDSEASRKLYAVRLDGQDGLIPGEFVSAIEEDRSLRGDGRLIASSPTNWLYRPVSRDDARAYARLFRDLVAAGRQAAAESGAGKPYPAGERLPEDRIRNRQLDILGGWRADEGFTRNILLIRAVRPEEGANDPTSLPARRRGKSSPPQPPQARGPK